ncbi:MAG: sugar ABC transporter permease [Chloroflexi bacterium]|nr:sugar ABC transporter permease [Chloroflexota bacterium]
MAVRVASPAPAASPRRSLFAEIYRQRVSYLFVMPAFVTVAVFMYWPTFTGFFYAFTDWKPGIQELNFVGLDNFSAMLQDQYLRTGFINVLVIVVTTVLKELTVPLLVAELVFHLRSPRLQYWLRTLFVVPMVMPTIATLLLWVQIFDPNIGLMNQTLQAVGLDSLQRSWLGDADTALWAIVSMGFPWVQVLPFLIFLGGLMSIPQDLYDAAVVDGANPLQRFLRIDLPMLVGQVRLLIVLGVIQGFQAFYVILVMTGGGPYRSTTVPALEMYYSAFQHAKYGYACAIALVLFAIVMTITIINMTYLRSSVEHEAT